MLRARTPDKYASLADGGGAQKRSRLHAVRDRMVNRAMKALYAHDGHCAGSRARDARAHLVKAVGEVHNFGFFGGVFQCGLALRQRRGHHEIFRSAYAGQIQVDARARQLTRELTLAAQRIHLRAEPLKSLYVQIDGPLADGAAARQAHARASASGKDGAQDEDARAEPAHVFLMLGALRLKRAHRHVRAASHNLRAAIAQDLQKRVHVGNARNLLDDERILGK